MKTLDNVMVSFAMLECFAGSLLAAGFKEVFKTKAEQEATNRLYEENAKGVTPGLDVYRLNRSNAAGVKQADGGYLKFGEEGQKMVCPKNFVADMTKFGYRLVDVLIQKLEGDLDEKERQRVRFRLYFTRNPGEKFVLTHDQQAAARSYFNRSYYKLFGFFDPKSVSLEGPASPIQGSIVTLNFSGVINSRNFALCGDEIRDLRMVAENHFRCVPRPEAKPEKALVADWFPSGTTEEVVDRAFAQPQPRTMCPSRPSRTGASPS